MARCSICRLTMILFGFVLFMYHLFWVFTMQSELKDKRMAIWHHHVMERKLSDSLKSHEFKTLSCYARLKVAQQSQEQQPEGSPSLPKCEAELDAARSEINSFAKTVERVLSHGFSEDAAQYEVFHIHRDPKNKPSVAGALVEIETTILKSALHAKRRCKSSISPIAPCGGHMALQFFKKHDYTDRLLLDGDVARVVIVASTAASGTVSNQLIDFSRGDGREMKILMTGNLGANKNKKDDNKNKNNNDQTTFKKIPVFIAECDGFVFGSANADNNKKMEDEDDEEEVQVGVRIEGLLERLPHRLQNTRLEVDAKTDLLAVLKSCGEMLARIAEIVQMTEGSSLLPAEAASQYLDAHGFVQEKADLGFSSRIWTRKADTFVPYGFSQMRALWKLFSKDHPNSKEDAGCEGSAMTVIPGDCYVGFDAFGSMGRLGNQLFQYAALRGIGSHIGCPIPLLPTDLKAKESEGQQTIFASMFPNVKAMRQGPEYQWSYSHVEPADEMYDFDDRVLSSLPNTNFRGYFHSFRYFCNVNKELREELTLASSLTLYAKRQLATILGKYVLEGSASLASPVVGVHVRRGDNSNEVWFNLPPLEYIHNAMDLYAEGLGFTSPPVFVVVAGGARTQGGRSVDDMAWCKHHIHRPNVYFHEGPDELHDFAILRHCSHHILTSGTFGWWAAYLGGGTVVAWRQWTHHPQYSFRPGSFDREDNYFPPNWILLDAAPTTV